MAVYKTDNVQYSFYQSEIRKIAGKERKDVFEGRIVGYLEEGDVI
jgi:hypothetical protein